MLSAFNNPTRTSSAGGGVTRLEWLLAAGVVVVFVCAGLLDYYSPHWHEDIFPLQYIVTIIWGWGWIENYRRSIKNDAA